MLLPVDFPYWAFAALIVAQRHRQRHVRRAQHLGDHEQRARAAQRGVASGMRSTFQNSGTALSIGVFFSLMIAGLAGRLPHALTGGLHAQGVPARHRRTRSRTLPPVSTLFAAFLGVNPMQHLLAPTGVLAHAARRERQQVLTGREFFPRPDLRRRSTTAWSSCSPSRRCSR